MNIAGAKSDRADGPWELPRGWAWVKLKQLCSFIGRGRGPTYAEADGVPVVNQKCVRWSGLEKRHLRFTERQAFGRLSSDLRLRKGDILWNSTGTGTIGRALEFDGSIDPITVDSHITIVRLVEAIPALIAYFIQTIRVQHLVTEGNVGSTNQLELPRSFVEDLNIPLAPLPEQRRIVERIDALFAAIAEGEAALAEARKGLTLFRRALLKATVTGELTRDWRAANKAVETGADLLERIRAANRALLPNKKRGRRTKTDTSPLGEDLPELPAGWVWTSVGETASETDYGTSDKCDRDPSGTPVLRMGNIGFGTIDFSDLKFAPGTGRYPILLDGDLVFNRDKQRGTGWQVCHISWPPP